VVSVKAKGMGKTMSGEEQGGEREQTTDEVSKEQKRCQNWRS